MELLERNLMNKPEHTEQPVIVELIAPEGLGFGEGGISVKEQVRKGILTPEAPRHIHDLLINDPDVFKPIEAEDDGCGDGRPWNKIIQLITENDQKRLTSIKPLYYAPKYSVVVL